MPVDKTRTFGPTHLTLEACLETHRPQIVQALAARVRELEADNEKLRDVVNRRAPAPEQQAADKGAQPA